MPGTDPLAIAETIGRIAAEAGEAIIPIIETAIANGDVHTLEQLAKVVPVAEVLAARDEALIQQQRAKAAEALGLKP